MPVKKSKAEMLAEAKLEIRELAARIAEMEKQLKSVSDTKDYYSRLHSEAANKLEEMHILLMDSRLRRSQDLRRLSWKGVQLGCPLCQLASAARRPIMSIYQEWLDAKAAEAEAVAKRRAIEDQLTKHYNIQEAFEGTANFAADGYKVKWSRA